MNPSEYEIQREVEALRDLRRRSSTPGHLTIDPDLPSQSSPASPGDLLSHSSGNPPQPHSDDPFHLFWVPADVHPEIAPAEFRAFIKEHTRNPPPADLSRSSSQSSSSGTGLGRKKSMLRNQYRPSDSDDTEEEQSVSLRRNRSSHYASQGPQLTINDLQRLEELAEEASESQDATRLRSIVRRSLSLNVSPTALDSMKEVPEMGDEADAPIIVPPPGMIIRRAARTKIRKSTVASDRGGGSRFPPRRGSARAQQAATATAQADSERRDSDISSTVQIDEKISLGSYPPLPRPRAQSNDEASMRRPDPITTAYDAYIVEDETDTQASLPSVPPPVPAPSSPLPLQQQVPPSLTIPPFSAEVPSLIQTESPVQEEPSPATQIPQPESHEQLSPAIHHPQPQLLSSPTASSQRTSRSPSPNNLPPSSEPQYVPSPTSPPQESTFTPHLPSSYLPPSALIAPQPVPARKEKDKKSLFGKSGKKGAKEKEKEREGRGSEKGGGFFGFFSSKKKQEDPVPVSIEAGREAAQALLKANKGGKSRAPSPVPPGSPLSGDNWSRFPLHVERAIYRLSHIKLANPRRPLYEQVSISNLMFWYLGVINKAPQPVNAGAIAGPSNAPATAVAPGGSAAPNGGQSATATGPDGQQAEESMPSRDGEGEGMEQDWETKEKEEQSERERQMEQERLERERDSKKKETGRRVSLTKSTPAGQPQGNRRHEVPVKGPSYEMQHRAMEQEYGGGYQMNRPSSAPSTPTNSQGSPRSGGQHPGPYTSVPIHRSVPSPSPDQFYYSSDSSQPSSPPTPQGVQSQQQQQPRLPPGAMPPVDTSSWRNQKPQQGGRGTQSQPSSPDINRSRSPPGSYGPPPSGQDTTLSLSNRLPGRSLSATAVPSSVTQAVNGKLKKGASANAIPPQHYTIGPGRRDLGGMVNGGPMGEEEDVPLAVWQQQRRK